MTKKLSCCFMFDRHAFALVKDKGEEECFDALLDLFEMDHWGGIAGRWDHDESVKSFSVRNTDEAKVDKLREYVRSVYNPEEEQDFTRECDQCGFNPWVGWDSWRCPRHYDEHSCDGKIVPVVKEDQVVICDGCGNEIDPDVCGCGGLRDDGHDGHSFIPMGCDCYRAELPERVKAWRKMRDELYRLKKLCADQADLLRRIHNKISSPEMLEDAETDMERALQTTLSEIGLLAQLVVMYPPHGIRDDELFMKTWTCSVCGFTCPAGGFGGPNQYHDCKGGKLD
jgi:hypothetical protein